MLQFLNPWSSDVLRYILMMDFVVENDIPGQ